MRHDITSGPGGPSDHIRSPSQTAVIMPTYPLTTRTRLNRFPFQEDESLHATFRFQGHPDLELITSLPPLSGNQASTTETNLNLLYAPAWGLGPASFLLLLPRHHRNSVL
ncbi:hypothetical protein BC826DRAFT_1071171 [Russula brevipes]|nr:hypothetical protein BC826DRAFT_1071171 [Russula brevipes]